MLTIRFIVILLASSFLHFAVSILVLAEWRFSYRTFIFLNICFIFWFSKTSLTCCREASTQSDDSQGGWCVWGHVVCLLSLKTSRLTLKILHLNRSQNHPPANLSTSPTSSDSLYFWLSAEESRKSSLSQPGKLSQLYRRLGGLSATFHTFTNGLSAISGEKQLDICFFLHLDLNISSYSCSESSFVLCDRSINHQYNTDPTCSIYLSHYISCTKGSTTVTFLMTQTSMHLSCKCKSFHIRNEHTSRQKHAWLLRIQKSDARRGRGLPSIFKIKENSSDF